MIPDAVARPASREEVADVVAECAASGTSVTPAGSQTSMTGSSITDRGVLVSLAGMNRILDIDPLKKTVRVETGVRIGDLNRALVEHRLARK